MSLSFQEKSLWLILLGLVGSFGIYFALVFTSWPRVPYEAEVGPQHIVLFVGVVILLTVFQILGHVILAIFDRNTTTDERDRLISLKGTRNASYVLATGVFFSLCAAVFVRGNFVFVHLLLAFWVLAQLVETGSQLLLYRRGA